MRHILEGFHQQQSAQDRYNPQFVASGYPSVCQPLAQLFQEQPLLLRYQPRSLGIEDISFSRPRIRVDIQTSGCSNANIEDAIDSVN